MPRIKGTAKSGGRKPGTPNKVTTELRDRIKLFLETNFEAVKADYVKLDPEKKIAVFERLLKYVLPQLHNTSVDLNIEAMSDAELTSLINRLIRNDNQVNRP